MGEPRVGQALWVDAAAAGVILVIALTRLPTPFGGDQALNLLMGRVIAEGGSPYHDLWDLKHPGVFAFFAAGGTLFGFNELGIHAFEMLWMLALAVLTRVIAGQWLRTRAAAALAPVLVVGLYYTEAGERYLTQTEPLLQLPLLCCVWCSVAAARRRHRAWFVAFGVAAGVVITFKLVYAAIPAVLLAMTIRELRRGVTRPAAVVAPACWALAGVVAPVLVVVAYLAFKRVAGLAFWTFFEHPAEAAAAVVMEPRRLVWAARWFAGSFAPALFLAAIGVADALRRGRWDLMTSGLCAWLLVGGLLIAAQVISWWDYHFLVLVAPLGLLAARGVEAVASALRSRLRDGRPGLARACLATGLVLLFSPQILAASRAVSEVWGSRPLPLSGPAVEEFQAARYPHYASIRARTAFLRTPGSHPGPIYVIDTPAYYVLAGRPPAMPLLAPWFHPTDRLWHQWLTDLTRTSPAYVRVSDAALQTIVDSRPALRDAVARVVPLIERRYRMLSADAGGRWYVRADLGSVR
jgi:hypothetical protein